MRCRSRAPRWIRELQKHSPSSAPHLQERRQPASPRGRGLRRGARLWGSLGTPRARSTHSMGRAWEQGWTQTPPCLLPSPLFNPRSPHSPQRLWGSPWGHARAPSPMHPPSLLPAALKPDAFTAWAPARLTAWVCWQEPHLSPRPQHLCKETAPCTQPCPFPLQLFLSVSRQLKAPRSMLQVFLPFFFYSLSRCA